jgi:hypothetical protein
MQYIKEAFNNPRPPPPNILCYIIKIILFNIFKNCDFGAEDSKTFKFFKFIALQLFFPFVKFVIRVKVIYSSHVAYIKLALLNHGNLLV